MTHKPKNYWLNVWDGALFTTAMTLLPVTILLPAYVKTYFTDNVFLINLIPALHIFGFTAPQILMARHIESLTHRKKIMLITGLFQRIPWLLLGLSLLIIPAQSKQVHLALFFIFFAVYAVSSGINVPVWFDLLGKLTAPDRRGRLMATRQTIGQGLGIGAAFLAAMILRRSHFPLNYSILFLLFFALTSLSLFLLIFLDEHPSKEIKKKEKFNHYLKTLPSLLRKDRNYIHFLIASSILALAAMQGGLVTAYGIDTFELETKHHILAYITALTSGTGMVTLYIFGWLGDKYGHKLNLALSGFFTVLSMAFLLFFKNLTAFTVSFILMQLSVSTGVVSRTGIMLALCPERDRPTYVSLKNTLTAPISLAAPFLGAWIAQTGGYYPLFTVVMILHMTFVIYFLIFVKEKKFGF